MAKVEEVVLHKTLRVTSHTCDRCGGDLFEKGYQVASVDIERKEGTSYPGDYDAEVKRIDCCLTCFDTVVTPALLALGFVLWEGY